MDWFTAIGERTTDLQKNLDKLRQKYERKVEPKPINRLQGIETALPELSPPEPKPTTPTMAPGNPFRKPSPDTQALLAKLRSYSVPTVPYSPEKAESRLKGLEQISRTQGVKGWLYRNIQRPLETAATFTRPEQVTQFRQLAGLGAMAIPEMKPFQEMPTSEKLLTLAVDIGAAIPWGTIFTRAGKQVVKGIAKNEAINLYNTTFGNSLDRMITKRAAGMPAKKFNIFQNKIYDIFAENKPSVQEWARNRMLYSMGKKPNNPRQAIQEAVEATVSDIEKALIPKGTQTGAMAKGGKAFEQLTPEEITALSKAPTIPTKPAPVTPEVTRNIAYHGTSSVHLRQIQKEGLKPWRLTKQQLPKTLTEIGDYVYLSLNPETAKNFASEITNRLKMSSKYRGATAEVLPIDISGLKLKEVKSISTSLQAHRAMEQAIKEGYDGISFGGTKDFPTQEVVVANYEKLNIAEPAISKVPTPEVIKTFPSVVLNHITDKINTKTGLAARIATFTDEKYSDLIKLSKEELEAKWDIEYPPKRGIAISSISEAFNQLKGQKPTPIIPYEEKAIPKGEVKPPFDVEETLKTQLRMGERLSSEEFAARQARIKEVGQTKEYKALEKEYERVVAEKGVKSEEALAAKDRLLSMFEEKPAIPPEIAKVPPAQPPITEAIESVSPSGKPRTLADLNREAKGMRALKPEERAAIMDINRPIKEGELLYKIKPFEQHAKNLLQPDTPIKQTLRHTPGVKQIVSIQNSAQMERENPIAMIGVRKQIFEEIETGRSRLATLKWWNDADDAFKFQEIKGKWRATDIELSSSADTSKPYHATIHDLVEHPENYNLTTEQQRVLQIAQDMQRQILRDAQRAGVDAVELFNDYWRRIVTKIPKGKLDVKTRNRIGTRKGYTRQRVFDFVDEGAKAGYEYETHPLTSLQNRLEAGIRTISDQETRTAISKLPGVEKPLERLESRYPQTVEGAKQARQARDTAKSVFLGNKTVENETALRQAEADYITAMREIYSKKLEAGQPNIGELKLPNGRIAPAELVDDVRKWVDLPEIKTSRGNISNSIIEATRLFRTTLTNVDLAAGFIQGQSLFYRNNVAWWRSQANAIISLIDDPTAYVAKNFEIMDEGMRMGAISIPTEFMFTRGGLASIPTRIPVVGGLMKAFNRAFEWFIVTGQTELYKAARGAVIKRAGGIATEQKAINALTSLGSAIRKEIGTESYAILGIKPSQVSLEQLSLFAARFFRALTGFQAQVFTGGEAGHEARRAWASMLAGGLALTVGACWAAEKKAPNLTDPFAPDWLQFRIGKTYFNAFGPYYPYLRTQARVSFCMLQGNLAKAANEIKKFFSAKSGLPFRAIDMAAQFGVKGYYTTFEGKTLPRTPLGITEAFLGEMAVPISIQEAMKAIPEGRPESVVGEVFGLTGREKYPYFPEEMLAGYFDIPSNAIDLEAAKLEGTIRYSREEYRERNPDVDAMLFLKGYVTTIKTPAAYQEVIRIVKQEGYDPKQLRAVKSWQKTEQKRKELGIKDTNITLTDRLIIELLNFNKVETAPETLETTQELEKVGPGNPFRK